tara:strand:+ start:2475 stop:2918 length:444 start_codon:yes stop_codon:yes gene_type:complete
VISFDIINDYGSNLFYNSELMSTLIEEILIQEKTKISSLSVVLSNKKYLNMLKKKYFDDDQYTDVIAFNLEDDGEQIEGEIYISIDDVLENSKLFSTSFDNEFKRVFIHGILHLIGYDDNNKKNIKIMRKLEDKYLLNCKEEILHLK